MWIGEQITEYGVGNGISLIIMAGIIASLYPSLAVYFEYGFGRHEWQNLLLFIGAWGVAVVAVVYMTKAQRRIPIQQAKHTRGRRVYGGQRHFLPFKVNQAGVMPIIFGSALLVIPTMIGKALGLTWLEDAFGNQRGFWFVGGFSALIFFFAFFWTSMMFQPNEIAKNLQEGGSFIPGIRPGKPTAQFLEATMVRITLAGATFLALIAVFPSLLGGARHGSMDQVLIYFMSGTSILIVVGVALDLVEKINGLLVMRNYEGFLEGGQQTGQGAGAAGGWGRRST
ncbi:MAG: SecY family transport protein, partial [Planctomycetota bacterium]